ncbi:MAG: TRAP transporter TatT component family protein [Thermoanaerobaculia bacterium]
MARSTRRFLAPVASLFLSAFLLPACSVRKVGVNVLAGAIAGGGDTYASDDDPELVAAAIPFGLKTVEGLLVETPSHEGLLLAAVSGFTQYGYAFVQSEADYVEAKDLARATELRARARKLYGRALRYGLRGLEARHPGFREGLRSDARREKTLAAMEKADAPFLYWTGAAWGAAISLSKEDAELTADQGLVEAMETRALELDESFGQGAIHDFFIAYDGGRPPSAGGSVERARAHFARAVAISSGKRAAPYVSLAETVSVGTQDRAEFEALLKKALAVDPDAAPQLRLANTVAQRRASWLLARADQLFLE